MALGDKQFKKTEEDYGRDFARLSNLHREWRQWTKNEKRGFFPIFNPDFIFKFRDLSGNALKLFIFLGAHANSMEGHTTVSIQTMQNHFGATKRTINNWLAELRSFGLIIRIQTGFRRPTHTFLLPYHGDFLQHQSNEIKELIQEYLESSSEPEHENQEAPFTQSKLSKEMELNINLLMDQLHDSGK